MIPDLFDYLAAELVAVSTYHCTAMRYVHNDPATMADGSIDYTSSLSGEIMRFRPENLLQASFANTLANEIFWRPVSPSDQKRSMNEFKTQREIFNLFQVQSCFTGFFEANKPRIKESHGNHAPDWPDCWDFGRAVRNCLNHGNKVTVTSKREVIWQSFTLGSTLNGSTFYPDLMQSTDLLMLLLAMQSELTGVEVRAIPCFHS